MTLGLASSELVALCLESILYGVCVVLFAECFKVLCHKRRRKAGGNHRLIVVSSTLFVLITWHEIVDGIRLYSAYQQGQTENGADSYYSRFTSMLSIMKTSIYLVETAVSDLFLLYRCYIVWNSSTLVMALPVLLYVADIAMGIGAVFTLSRVGTSTFFNNEQQKFTNSFFSCTLALNAVCTGLIAFRIWRTQRQTRDAKMGSNLSHVAVIVIESGAVYLTVLACGVGTFVAKSFLFNIALDITSPVIGIVFSLIIVRIGRGISSEETTKPVQSISYSMPSKTSGARSNGPIIFKSTTTTQMTDSSATTYKGAPEALDATYKMELRSDGDSSIDA